MSNVDTFFYFELKKSYIIKFIIRGNIEYSLVYNNKDAMLDDMNLIILKHRNNENFIKLNPDSIFSSIEDEILNK